MNGNSAGYDARVRIINENASRMKEVLIMPVLEDSGNKFLDDRKLRA